MISTYLLGTWGLAYLGTQSVLPVSMLNSLLVYLPSFCCTVTWGWTNEFEAENLQHPQANDYITYCHVPAGVYANEVCYPLDAAGRCYASNNVQCSSCSVACLPSLAGLA